MHPLLSERFDLMLNDSGSTGDLLNGIEAGVDDLDIIIANVRSDTEGSEWEEDYHPDNVIASLLECAGDDDPAIELNDKAYEYLTNLANVTYEALQKIGTIHSFVSEDNVTELKAMIDNLRAKVER